MLLDNMKSLIKYVIELDIDYLEIFLGYEGDKVLHIITGSKDVVTLINAYAKNLDLDCKHEYDLSGKYGAAFNLYIGVEDSSIYKFKNETTKHDKEFKTVLVLEVLKHKRALADIAHEHDVSPKILRDWKKTFLANAARAMESKIHTRVE
ncbi:transposase [bacterium]|nr:transposase [bacterium]